MPGQSLRIRDIRAVDRIVGECEELWYDAMAWQTHLLRAGAAFVGLRVGLMAELRDFDPGQRPQIISAVECGWDSERQRQAFFPLGGRSEPFSASPVDLRFRELLAPRRAVTRVRRDLMSDNDWREAPVYRDVHRPAGMDEIAYSAKRTHDGSRVSILAFGGDEHVPGPRQRRILALLHHEIARRAQERLSTWTDVGAHHLSARQREVFDLLITGCDEKAIARKLSRARSTITEHIGAIYAHFGVKGRHELFALLLRRRATRISEKAPGG